MNRKEKQSIRRVHRAALCIVLSMLVGLGCSKEPEASNEKENNTFIPPPDMTTDGPKWSVSTVDSEDVGRHLRMAVDGSKIAIAYYALDGVEVGPCEELGDDPPQKVEWTLYYGEYSGNSWAIEEAGRWPYLGIPQGLDLKFSPDGEATIAAMVGEPLEMQRFCGANDVGILTRQGSGQWSEQIAVTNSGQAASGEAGSDFGEVVGYWPALAFDGAGNPSVVYKDVHSGSIMSDDLRRADLELAWGSGGGFDHIPVDIGKGGGNFNQMLFGEDGQPYIVYYNQIEANSGEPRRGVWVATTEDNGDTWQRVQLFNMGTPEGPSMVFDEDGNLAVVFYQSSKGFPQLARLVDPSSFENVSTGWTLEDIGDSRFDEGYTPSLAVAPSGNLAVAYYRCGKATNGLGECKDNEDAVIFAYEDGGVWTHELVDAGGQDGACGNRPAMAFDGQGRPVMVYRCEELVDGGLRTTVKFARRVKL